MARNYAMSGSQTVTSPTDTMLTLTGATTIRPAVYDLVVGSPAVPADNALEFILQRTSADGTGTGVTPEPLDPADPAALSTAKTNHTVEPTYTSGKVLLDLVMNQRATQRWVATPGKEIRIPATAAAGVGLQPVHASFTGDVTGTIWFED